jgi:mRNA-degrading endonuclease RelE of RelBE toxin-antitoxin system
MNYEIKALEFFKDQISKQDEKTRRIIYDKINLIKENPYRYKRIRSKKYSKVFRIRFSIQNREIRLIYVILEPHIILVCLLDRTKDYKDLEKYLAKIEKENK